MMRFDRFTVGKYIKNGELTVSKKEILGNSSLHWHEFYEIEYLLDGDGDYIIDGKHYPMCRGMFFLMTPANFHEVKTDHSRAFNVMFSDRACSEELLARCISSNGGLAFSVDEGDRAFFEALLDELCLNQSNPTYSACLLNALLCKSIDYVRRDPKQPSYVGQAVLYLLSNFRRSPSLSEVAAHVGYTPNYFCAIFKRDVGESFKEFLDRLRFDYAKKLVLSSTLSAAQICKESGFSDYPNFIRRFILRFGISPMQMRKEGIS
ncbi:MAG: helix-turn-helix domain-containing protein [Ruminococcaceae bacterium]|nr:helix-turn-helix domain-containing protein [Oscillospiraceae bacterium]